MIFLVNLNQKSMKSTPPNIKNRSFIFALSTLRLCKSIGEIEREFIITKQLSRSATSVGANVREAQNAESKKDFIHKLAIAQKECNESLYWFELLVEFVKTNKEEIIRLKKEAHELHLILSSIIVKTKENISIRNASRQF